jgi:hypothetical protein
MPPDRETTVRPSAGSAPRRKIFVSYRREDDGWALTITLALREHFGAGRVFQDVDSIEVGSDFVDRIDQALEESGAMVAIVGRDWLQLGPAGDGGINNPADFVRIEVETAIKKGVKIVPVLIGLTEMPPVKSLPPEIAAFGRVEAKRVNREYWEQDVRKLAKALEAVVGKPTPAPRSRARTDTAAGASPPPAKSQPATAAETSPFGSTARIGSTPPLSTAAAAWRERWNSPEAVEARAREAARQAAIEAEKEPARRAARPFTELPAWWFSMILTVVACVSVAAFVEPPVRWLAEFTGNYLEATDSIWPIFLVALAWAATYIKTGTDSYVDDPRRGRSTFITRGLLGGWALLGSDEKRAAVTSAFPLSISLAWGVARLVVAVLDGTLPEAAIPVGVVVLFVYSFLTIRNYRNTAQVFRYF